MKQVTLDATFAALLAHLHRGGQAGYYWRKGPGSTWWNGDGPPAPPAQHDVYFGVHPATAQGGPGERTKIATIAALNCLFAEFDAKDFGDDKTAALAHVQQLEPPPSAIIDSGGGWHAYWLLLNPWQLASDAERQRAKELQARWVAYVGGDTGAKDLARVLRVPGTFNRKYSPPRPVSVVRCDLTILYDLGELAALVRPPPPDPAPTAAKATPRAMTAGGDRRGAYGRTALAQELARVATARNGTRNDTLAAAAFSVGQLVAEGLIDATEAERELIAAGVAAGLPVAEAAATVRHQLAEGQQQPRGRRLPDFDTLPSVAVAVTASGPTASTAAPAGQVAPILGPTAAMAAALERLGYHFVLNTETDEILLNGALLDDVSRGLLRGVVRDQRLGRVGILDDAIMLQAHQHRQAPIRDGLLALQGQWDGGAHIAQLAAHLTTRAGDVITYADGTKRRAAEVFVERFLLAGVGRVLDGAQNLMLVLDGPQGIGKSAWAKWLGGVLPGTFCEESINPTDRDCLLRLTKTLIWEAGELDQATRKHDAAALKHFLTRSSVTARRPYGRHDIQKPVLASFIGSVNATGNGFLSDPTGNRRYMVVTLTAIDWGYTRLDPRQIWAETVARYLAGERGELLPEEAAYRDRINREEHQTTGLMDDWLAMYFELTGSAADMLTSGEIAAHLQTKGATLGNNDRAAAMAIADALSRAGIKRAERDAARKHYGDHRRAWAGIAVRLASSGGAMSNQPTSSTNQPSTNFNGKVGLGHQHAVNRPTQPTKPTSTPEKDLFSGYAGALEAATDSEKNNLSEEVIRLVEVGLGHQEASTNLSGRLVEVGLVGGGPPPGVDLVRCDHHGHPTRYGIYWKAAHAANGEETDPDQHQAAVISEAWRRWPPQQAAVD